jgi:hypothetical protein
MKPEMSHEAAFAELDAIAFDLLDAVERDAIMAHVSRCAECRAELAALRETVADLAYATPAVPAPTVASHARIRERLVARAASDAQSRRPNGTPILLPRVATPPAAQGAVNWRRPGGWLTVAAGILFVASLGAIGWLRRGRQDLMDALKSQAMVAEAARHAVDSLSDQLARRDSLVAEIAGRDVSALTLTSPIATEPYARMFWDRTRHTWTMIAHRMPELRSGRTYQLWLVTPTSKISAGTFTVRNGDAVVRATYDLTEPLSAIAVTDEPAGGVAQPTGQVIVAAQSK